MIEAMRRGWERENSKSLQQQTITEIERHIKRTQRHARAEKTDRKQKYSWAKSTRFE